MILNLIYVFLVHFLISKFNEILSTTNNNKIKPTGLFSAAAERAAAAASAAALLLAICCCKISLLFVKSSFFVDVR